MQNYLKNNLDEKSEKTDLNETQSLQTFLEIENMIYT